MCVWCPRWPVQRLRSQQPELRGRPLILFVEGRRGLFVSACSGTAARQGLRVGMPLSEARSLFPEATHQRRQALGKPVWMRADPDADRTQLRTLALHCQQYSPIVGLEDVPEPESLWFDISGSETFFGGEQGLVEAVSADLAQQGIRTRIAIANAWGAAWGMSHFGELEARLVSAEEHTHALAPLPVAALRIPDNVIDSLQTLDVSTIGRLMHLPRTSLPSRFGKELVRRLDQALGLVPELLTAERLIEPLAVEWLFEEPIADRQVLDHVCRTLLERVLVLLDQRRAGLRELNCCWLGTTIEPISLRLWRPSTDLPHLLELLRLHCERCCFTSAVTGIRLEIIELGLPRMRQATLFADSDTERPQRLLEELVERVAARLGAGAVLRSHLRSDPLPEFSCEHRPWLEKRSWSTPETAAVASRLRCRPLRLLCSPQSLRIGGLSAEGWPTNVDRSQVIRINGPERIESGWWRGPEAKRDYYRFELANGARLWVFCDRSSGRWFLHGLFS
ncbi:MAG: DNA polymerase Y family protein [Planctomycetales bacterium]|nr:DNA polymerase Y family protein [Planctomycetales bacterium]